MGLNLAYRAASRSRSAPTARSHPHTDAAEELGLMVSKGGMTPRDALIAATKGGADLLELRAKPARSIPANRPI